MTKDMHATLLMLVLVGVGALLLFLRNRGFWSKLLSSQNEPGLNLFGQQLIAPTGDSGGGVSAIGGTGNSASGGGNQVAKDGQTLASQPVNVVQMFTSAYGNNAPSVWAQQHNTAIGAAA